VFKPTLKPSVSFGDFEESHTRRGKTCFMATADLDVPSAKRPRSISPKKAGPSITQDDPSQLGTPARSGFEPPDVFDVGTIGQKASTVLLCGLSSSSSL
jgi:hypothetical protein